MHSVPHADRIDLDGRWRFQLLPAPDAEPAADVGRDRRPRLLDDAGLGRPPALHECGDALRGSAAARAGREPHRPLRAGGRRAGPLGGRRIVLHVGAAESVLIARVNGREVGISKDSHLAAEFDVTDVVAVGRNTISLTVVKWSDASYVEDQDQWWHGGITRSVFLYATSRVYLADVRAVPTLADEPRQRLARGAGRRSPSRACGRSRAGRVEARLEDLTGTLTAPVPHTGRFEGPRPSRHRRVLADRAIAGHAAHRGGARRASGRASTPISRRRTSARSRCGPTWPRSTRGPRRCRSSTPSRSSSARRPATVVEEVVAAGRVPTGGDRRAGPAHQRPAGLHPGGQPPRLRPRTQAA